MATVAPIDIYDSFAAQLEHLPALGAGGDFEIGLSFKRGHRDYASKRGERKWDRQFAKQVVLFALKYFVLLYMDNDIKIAGSATANSRLAVARRAEARAAATLRRT